MWLCGSRWPGGSDVGDVVLHEADRGSIDDRGRGGAAENQVEARQSENYVA